MRTECKVAALSLALLVSACSKRPEPTASLPDDLKKDLAAASQASSPLATAPQSYQPMRFVSDIERTRATERAPRPKVSTRHERMAPTQHGSGNPVASLASNTIETVTTPSNAPSPEPTTVVAAMPAPDPMVAPVGGPSDAGAADAGRGIGSVLGGILAGVVIRGGHAGPDKCDPRTDGRARGSIGDRPDFRMPVMAGQPIFSRGRGRGGL
jgi:hypothetical protein